MKKFYKYRWLFMLITAIICFTLSYLFFPDEFFNSAWRSLIGAVIGGGFAICFLYYYDKKKMHKAEKVQGSDTLRML